MTHLELIERLRRLGVELTEEQRMSLYDSNRTFLYAQRKKEKDKANILYRMSILFYLLWVVLLRLVVQPLKWLITGDEYLNMNNPIYKFTIKWGRKLGYFK